MKKYLPALVLALVFASPGVAQELAVSGKVTAAGGEAIPGVSVFVKGTQNGAITDADGLYTIQVNGINATLVFSFIGYSEQEIQVGGRTRIDIELQPSLKALDEVVVTALGIKREEKSLGFSVGRVQGPEFTKVARENFLTSMQGKVAGVTINETGGAGSTVSVNIRGAKSMSTDNQPLYVVDGVPLVPAGNNGFSNIGGFGSGNSTVDYGSTISDIDPESIESVSVLKGPQAAALYGTRAGNGVILITTKKAKEGSGMKITLTTNNSFDMPEHFLNVQKNYAGAYITTADQNGGSYLLPPLLSLGGTGAQLDKGYLAVQWDSPLDANGQPIPKPLVSHPNNVKNFLNSYGLTSTNSASITNATKFLNYRLGITNMTNKGLIPNSDFNKNNLSLSASSKLNEKLTISTDINFVNSYSKNRPAGDRGTNPLQWAYYTPAYVDIRELRNYNIGQGNTIKNVVPGDTDNPYMLAYDVNNSFNRYQLFGNVMANWQITSKFTLMGRMAMDKIDEMRETKIGQGYSQESNNGAYGIANSNSIETNFDGLFSYKDHWKDFSLTASAGGNTRYNKATSVSNSSHPGSGLIVPNLYTLSNIAYTALDYSSNLSQKGINSVYGMANLSWREAIFLDVTARNDWSSTLPANHRSYFYPSASLSVLLNELVNLGSQVDMLKLRGGWAQVGNDTSPYNLTQVYNNSGQWGNAIQLNKQSTLLTPSLMPEQATSTEVGVEGKFFGNRIRFDGTIYQINNRNQIFQVPLTPSTGFSGVNINAGLVQSKGVELLIGGTPLKTDNWSWDVNVNFTKNQTVILDLASNVPYYQGWSAANVLNRVYAKDKSQGYDGNVGNLLTQQTLRVTDKSSPYYNYPIIAYGDDPELQPQVNYSKIGNYNPKFIMGLQTTLTYKNISLGLTFDWRHGGQYVSQTFRYINDDMLTQAWANHTVTPSVSGGLSQNLRDWTVANANKLMMGNSIYPIGGLTPQTGGLPDNWSSQGLKDGVYYPGVYGTETDGHFTLDHENLGGPGTVTESFNGSNLWGMGWPNVYAADYIKLREITLNYNLPKSVAKKLKMDNIYFSLYSRNIILWTKDHSFGVDPERAFLPGGGPNTTSNFAQGQERYNVMPWTVPVGFKIGLMF